MTSRTVFVPQEGPANALALNKDNSQIVIAGRNGKILLLIRVSTFLRTYVIYFYYIVYCICLLI